jgi:chromosomal replication initiator protein
MTQPKSHDDNPMSVTALPPARRDSGKADDDDLMDDGLLADRLLVDSQMLMTLEPNPSNPVTAVLASLRDDIGEQNFQHWFHKRTRFKVSGDRFVVFVANPFILNWLLRRFRSALNRAAQLVLGPSASCQLEVDGSLLHEAASSTSITDGDAVAESGEVQKDVSVAAGTTDSASSRKRTNSAKPQPSEFDRPGSLSLPNNRRKFRSFESFVSGECNDLAVLAARQVSAAPGERYNPLFIHGGTGTGKTHLLEAIYTESRRQHPTKNVMYLTSEAFTNYFTSALASRTVPSFRQRFRNVDVLLIDNIEFLDNKRATQEEFLHTIVQVIEHGGQVVVSCDRHPRMLTKHREELTTRFVSGLVCRIEAPDEATRLKLVRSMVVGTKAVFSDDALDYIVRRCRRNAREIQGAINQLEGQFSLTGRRITLAVTREILGEMAEECRRLVRISDVEKVVCEAFGVTAADLRSPSRRKAIALPRAVAMFLSRRMTKSAYREIGMYFGGRDHSTVVAAERKVTELVTKGEALDMPTSCPGRTFGELIDELEQRLTALAS